MYTYTYTIICTNIHKRDLSHKSLAKVRNFIFSLKNMFLKANNADFTYFTLKVRNFYKMNLINFYV